MNYSTFNTFKTDKKSAIIGNSLNNLNKFLDKINNCREKLVYFKCVELKNFSVV